MSENSEHPLAYTPEFLSSQVDELVERNRNIITEHTRRLDARFELDLVASHFQDLASYAKDDGMRVVNLIHNAPVAADVAEQATIKLFSGAEHPGYGGAVRSDERYDYQYWRFGVPGGKYFVEMKRDRCPENGVMPLAVHVTRKMPDGYDEALKADKERLARDELSARVERNEARIVAAGNTLRKLGKLAFAVRGKATDTVEQMAGKPTGKNPFKW